MNPMKSMINPLDSSSFRQVQSAQVWNRIRRGVATSLAAACIFVAHSSAFGASYYWDFDADATIGTPPASTAGSGTWNAANTNWNLAGAAGSDVAWVTNNDAVFAGSDGTYAITLGSNLTVGNITFSNSGYTLSAASALKLSQFNAASVLTVATGATATIGSNVAYENTNGSTLSITGTATAGNPAGTLIIDNGGKVNTTHTSAIVYVGSTSTTNLRSTTVQVNTGGTLSSAGSLVANGLLKVNGGTVSTTGTGVIVIGNFADANMPASAILTIDGGDVTSIGGAGVRFGTSTNGGTTNTGGTLNLNGGTLNTAKIYSGNGTSGLASSSTVNFNGGTLKASASNTIFLSSGMINNAIVKAGGAIIDTNTFDVTISKALTHDAGLGGTADGGLTKNSTGTLLLSGNNTYTGATVVSGGTLKLGAGGSISSSSGISVSGGATIDNGNGATVTHALTLQEGAAILTSAASSAFSPASMTLTGNLSDGWTAISLTASGGGGLVTKGGQLTLTLTGITAGTYNLTSGSNYTGSFSSANVNGSSLTASGADFTGTNIGGFNYNYTNSKQPTGRQCRPRALHLGALGLQPDNGGSSASPPAQSLITSHTKRGIRRCPLPAWVAETYSTRLAGTVVFVNRRCI